MQETKAKILIIDDDYVDTKFISKALKKSRVSNVVETAENGEEGLKILRKGIGQMPYVVLLDLNMPRMDGHEFLEELRADEHLKSTVVFVLTTSNDEEDRWKAYQKNISGYLVKKKIESEFLDRIRLVDQFLSSIELPPLKKPI